MTPRFLIRPLAEQEIAEAILWYEEHDVGLGGEFLRAVDVRLGDIKRRPDSVPEVYPRIRRALLARFPYALFFVVTEEVINVIACMHTRRDPRRWQRRA